MESVARESTEGCYMYLLTWLAEHSNLIPQWRVEEKTTIKFTVPDLQGGESKIFAKH